MIAFAHDEQLGTTTMSELLRVHSVLSPDKFFGCYAYATQSGFRAFELNTGDEFWHVTSSRWLFGIDYGRTDPRALREIAKRPNAEVRIFDGTWVVDQGGFLPRRDFHAKVAMMENTASGIAGMVLGSGNFSYNGLLKSVEAGSTVIAKSKRANADQILPVKQLFESLWKQSCALHTILATYETRRVKLALSTDSQKPAKPTKVSSAFWIEAGYVTKNRGPDKPGNQIFFPNGFRMFFSLHSKVAVKGAVIGPVAFKTLVGPGVTSNLRLNRNGMEKMSLPTPEEHGFGVYDGKILVFESEGAAFLMSVVESTDFEAVYGHRVVDVQRMNGGRRYGALV